MIGRQLLVPLVVCALLGGCGEAETDPGPGGVTVGEARALDEAAAMLDQQRLPEEALIDPADDPASEPAPEPASEPALAVPDGDTPTASP